MFTMAAVKKGDHYIHRWYLGPDGGPSRLNLEEVEAKLDEYLQNSNKSYRGARKKALAGLEVKVISKDRFYAWAEQEKKKGGQIKTPRMMKEEQFGRWEAFIHSKS